MCCRYTQTTPQEELERLFHLQLLFDYLPRYNFTPSQTGLVVRDYQGQRQFAPMAWGLVPRWAKPGTAAAAGMVNARSETIDEKPSFREAVKLRRCLVPADGFIEWQMGKSQGKKPPYWLRLVGGLPFAFAGIWEASHQGDSYAIVTTEANELVREIHDRMPVMLLPHQYETWMDPYSTPELRAPLYQPLPSSLMTKILVNPALNNWRNEGPEYLQEAVPVAPARGLFDDVGA